MATVNQNNSVNSEKKNIVRAKLSKLRISSQKVRLVLDLIRSQSTPEAINILKSSDKRSAPIILKLLNSAISNAVNNHQLDGDKLYIHEIFANEGKTFKRSRTRAKGRSDERLKRTSHVVVLLKERISLDSYK